MRTSIFNKFADLPKEFREDMEVLWSIPRKQRLSLIPHVTCIYRARTSGDSKVATDEAVKEIGGNAANLLRALKFLVYIYREWSPTRDTPDGFLQDLVELDLIPSAKAKEARDFLISFLMEVQKDNKRRIEKMHAGSLLPSFVGCSVLVDFRAVIDKPFGTGLQDKLEAYDPTCISFVPVFLVKLRVDSGDPNCLTFQCEEEDLPVLIEELRAAVMDLAAARRTLPEGEGI